MAYYHGEVIVGADPKSFEVIGTQASKDANEYYWRSREMTEEQKEEYQESNKSSVSFKEVEMFNDKYISIPKEWYSNYDQGGMGGLPEGNVLPILGKINKNRSHF